MSFLITFMLGEAFLPSAGVARVLLLSFSLTVWNVLLSIVFYALGHARLMAAGAYVSLAVFAGSALFLTGPLGMMGVAISKLIADAAYLGFVFLFLPRVVAKTAEEPCAAEGEEADA
jgi:O-antigen/teichoic acid export membrane protein